LELAKTIFVEQDYQIVECYINLADNYQKLGDEDKAEDMFKQCLSTFEDFEEDREGSAFERPSVMHRIAVGMRVKQEFEKAADLLEKVLDIK